MRGFSTAHLDSSFSFYMPDKQYGDINVKSKETVHDRVSLYCGLSGEINKMLPESQTHFIQGKYGKFQFDEYGVDIPLGNYILSSLCTLTKN